MLYNGCDYLSMLSKRATGLLRLVNELQTAVIILYDSCRVLREIVAMFDTVVFLGKAVIECSEKLWQYLKLLFFSENKQPKFGLHFHTFPIHWVIIFLFLLLGGGWGCEVSCGGHHWLRGKTTTGSALDGAVFDIAQILAYLVPDMSRSQLYLGFGHFVWLSAFFGQ